MRIDLAADTGACDSLMPRKGPWAGIEIVPSEMSRREDEYEVANAESIPNLGERHLAIWPEGSSQPRHLCMQVADVHKPLLSLSRCADLGYESRFGKSAGALVDGNSITLVNPKHKDLIELVVSLCKKLHLEVVADSKKWVFSRYLGQFPIPEAKKVEIRIVKQVGVKLTKSDVLVNDEKIADLFFS